MSVFGHGQLRLYLLALLRQGPRHGYDVIRDLEHRFSGLYSPSAGTVYPRLAKLEEEGLVVRREEGRKALYRLTDAGRAEVEARGAEIDALEASLDASANRLADEVRRRVRASSADLRAQVDAATAGVRDATSRRAAPENDTEVENEAGTHRPVTVDLDAVIGGLSRGRLPDAETIAGAMRRWGVTDRGATVHPDAGPGVTPGQDASDAAPPHDAPPHDGGTPSGPGFPSSAQVREVIGILQDAGERIAQVLGPHRG